MLPHTEICDYLSNKLLAKSSQNVPNLSLLPSTIVTSFFSDQKDTWLRCHLHYIGSVNSDTSLLEFVGCFIEDIYSYENLQISFQPFSNVETQ